MIGRVAMVAGTVATLIVAVVVGAIGVNAFLLARADGAAVLVLVEDGHPGERRADSILLVRWWRACDVLTVTSLPRDMIAEPGGEPLAVLHHTIGARRLADTVGRLLDVPITATATTDLRGVERIARAVGPVTIDLPAESLDRRTGFHAGPGPVTLEATDAVVYLRSRTWEERRGGEWVLVEASDLLRLDHLHGYLTAAADAVDRLGPHRRTALAIDVARTSDLRVLDHLALVGLLLGARSTTRTAFDTVPVVAERTADERRSPFAPADLDANHRLVLAGRVASAADVCGPEDRR